MHLAAGSVEVAARDRATSAYGQSGGRTTFRQFLEPVRAACDRRLAVGRHVDDAEVAALPAKSEAAKACRRAVRHISASTLCPMPLSGEGFQLVGVSVAGDGPVRSTVHLELDASVQALYGQNGAGKSRLLGLVSSALSGVALESRKGEEPTLADLHIQIENTDARPFPGTFTSALERQMAARVKESKGTLAQTSVSDALDDSHIQELIARESRDDIWTHLAALIDLTGIEAAWPKGLSDELYDSADAGHLTLRAAGTRERPAWDVYLSLSMTGARKRLDEASEAWRQLQAIADLGEDQDRGERLDTWVRGPGQNVINLLSAAAAYWRPGTGRQTIPRDSWPSWLQVPALLVAEKVEGTPALVVGTRGGDDIDEGTIGRVLELVSYAAPGRARPDLVTAVEAGVPTFSTLMKFAVGKIERDANKYANAVLLDPPSLRFKLETPDLWLSGKMPHWEYLERSTTEWLPIDQLSSARERWVRLAVELAIAPVDKTPALFICDEPERGLHRLAEGRLSQGLPVLARTRPFGVLAATHSPALLGSTHIRPLLVSRNDESGAQVRPVSMSIVDRVATEATALELGMSVGDLWPLSRVTVVVEGLHDEAVFTSLLRESLDAAPAGVYATHGGTRLKSLAEPALIINATDAEILVVLDELQSSVVDPLWTEIRRSAAAGDFDAARTAIDALRQHHDDSFLFLHQFALRALESSCLDRVHVHGLSLPDVICYLPEDELLLKPEPWTSLISRWRSDAAAKNKKASNIKKWLKQDGALTTDEKQLDQLVVDVAHRTAQAGQPIHEDLAQLGIRIRELAGVR